MNVATVPVMNASAVYIVDEEFCGDNITWKLYSDGLLIISGKGEMWNCYEYGSPWDETLYDNNISIEKVIIEDGVTKIGDGAFYCCYDLTSVTIPNSVTDIGMHAFGWCSALETVTLSDGLTEIGAFAFDGCTNIKSIVIPNGVKTIECCTFSWCENLSSVTIPNSVTRIGEGAFYGMGYYNNSSNWENGVLYIGNYLIKASEKISGAYEIKAGTKCIGDQAFYECSNLTKVTIPNSVTHIGDDTFYDCINLANIVMGNSVTSIDDGAFCGCSSLKSITLPKSITNIGAVALGYVLDYVEEDFAKVPGFTIYGFAGTVAETYAKENGFTFVAHKHSYTSKVIKPPTCTATGTTKYTCSCGYSYTANNITATGHKSVALKAVSATCTTAGKTAGTKCSVCGKILTAQKAVPAKGHTYTTTTAKATTSKNGAIVTKCTTCGAVKSNVAIAKVSSIKLNKNRLSITEKPKSRL